MKTWMIILIGAVGIGLALAFWPNAAPTGVAQPGINKNGAGAIPGSPTGVNSTSPAAYVASSASAASAFSSLLSSIFSPGRTPLPAGSVAPAPYSVGSYGGFVGPLPVSALDANGNDIALADSAIAGNGVNFSSMNFGSSLDSTPMIPGTTANLDASLTTPGVNTPSYDSSFSS